MKGEGGASGQVPPHPQRRLGPGLQPVYLERRSHGGRLRSAAYEFPSNPWRRTEWIRLVRRENFKPSKHTFLCSKHFEQTCFDRTGQTRRLREDAVPTIFDFPPHMQNKLVSRKTPLTSAGISNQQDPSKSSSSTGTSTRTTGTNTRTISTSTRTTGTSTSTSPCTTSSTEVFQEHSYCLANPVVAKRKVFQLQDEVDYLRQQIRISRQRERRVVKKWRGISNLLEDLKERNLLPKGKGAELVQSVLTDESFKGR
ncbi:THAP domain-containing protein 2-like isoform X2 [Chiloscyllium plagiosum]|uniref:THAP domain-containing protein 2-like isoform X2 n=1 Tax=Chiloscyllium plagiosum TaxID=36176 RepID=UPI001CB83699|nr:THAP domain-containing protein 2-like isoform X2 [Chiloscyllium plagiosum]